MVALQESLVYEPNMNCGGIRNFVFLLVVNASLLVVKILNYRNHYWSRMTIEIIENFDNELYSVTQIFSANYIIFLALSSESGRWWM